MRLLLASRQCLEGLCIQVIPHLGSLRCVNILWLPVSFWHLDSVSVQTVFILFLFFRWYRVVVKGILRKGFLSVYVLDYGKHEVISIDKIQPLLDKFRKLPFQAIKAQLAGMYSASFLFLGGGDELGDGSVVMSYISGGTRYVEL